MNTKTVFFIKAKACVIALASASFPVTGAELKPVLAFREVLTQEVPVSGSGMIVGVEYTAKESSKTDMQFEPHVYLSQDLATETSFCVSVKSSDGRYSAQNEFVGSPPISRGWTPIDYKSSRFLDNLKDWCVENRLAIAVSKGSCATKHLSQYIPSTIQKPKAELSHLSLSVSSLAAVSVETGLQSSSGQQVRGVCKKIDDVQTTGFDYRCQLPLPKSTEQESTQLPFKLRVVRKSQTGEKEIEQIFVYPNR